MVFELAPIPKKWLSTNNHVGDNQKFPSASTVFLVRFVLTTDLHGTRTMVIVGSTITQLC